MPTKPFMQLYVADYMADTSHLTTLEHGAYLLLIMAYWQSGKPIRNDRLTNVTKMSNEDFNKIKTTLSEFFIDDGTYWHQKRIDEELEKFAKKSEQARGAGFASAAKRWGGREKLTDVTNPLPNKNNENVTITDNRQQITDNRYAGAVAEVTKNICMINNQVEQDLIKEWAELFSLEWIREAVKLAGLNKARNIKYVDSILRRWGSTYKPEEKPWEVVGNGRSARAGRKNETESTDWDRERAAGGL